MLSFFLTLIIFLNFFRPILATDATSSAQDVQTIREAVQQKVKEKLNIINTPSSKPKSFFGTIQKITDQQIEIFQNDEAKTVIATDDTAFINLKRNKITLSDLKPGEEILAMGYINSQNQLDAKRIVVIELKNSQNTTQVVAGQVVDISQTSPVFVLVPFSNKEKQFQIETTSNTLKGISTGQKIITVIKPDEEISNTFKLIDIISSKSSASVSATPTP
jgi:hypothetical protein